MSKTVAVPAELYDDLREFLARMEKELALVKIGLEDLRSDFAAKDTEQPEETSPSTQSEEAPEQPAEAAADPA